MPVWARDTAFPEAPAGWGWVGPKDDRHPCASAQDLEKAIKADDRSRICLVWTPENPRMVLPEEVDALRAAVLATRNRWVRDDLEDTTIDLRRALVIFGLLFAWVFYRQFGSAALELLPMMERLRAALRDTINQNVIELGFLLLVIFRIIPWYQARKRGEEMKSFSSDTGFGEAIPPLRFEIWLERQKAPFTWIFLGLIGLVGLAQFLPGNAGEAAGLMKSRYPDEWWRLFTAPFLHGHPIHFAMNAAAMLYLGKRMEVFARWPHLPLVFLFAACVGGQVSIQLLRPETIGVGASGGLMGWLGFLLVFETLHARLVPKSARRRLLGAVFLTALIGVLGYRYIDNAAHAGGLIAGMLYAVIVFPKSSSVYRPQMNRTDLIVGSIALALTVFCAAFTLWKICAPPPTF